MKSLCPLFRSALPCHWGAISLVLLLISRPGLTRESDDSPAGTVETAESDAPGAGDDNTGSGESESDGAEPEGGDVEPESGEAETADDEELEGVPEELETEPEPGSFLNPTEESQVLEERRAGAETVEDIGEERTGLYWDFGPQYSGLDGNLTLVFGSRMHLDTAWFDESSAIEAEIGGADDDIEFRRVYAEVAGVAYRQFEFKAQFNFAGSFDVRDLYAGLVGIPFLSAVRVGHIREPFSLDMMTGSNSITFLERALPTVFAPNRNLGVMMHRRFTKTRRIYSAIGIFQDTVNNPDFTELREDFGDGNFGLTARVTGLPIASDDRRELLHLGVGASFRNPSDDTLRYRSRPESFLAQNYVDTGEFKAEDELRLGGEIATVMGPLSLQGEFIMSVVNEEDDDVDFDDRVFPSFYAQASYVLTGEHRSYREKVGAFGRVHPENPFPLEGWGAWEVAARYSYLDLDSKDIEGGVLHDWTLGVNWYLNHYSRLMFNYVLAHPEGHDFAQIWQMRLQIAF